MLTIFLATKQPFANSKTIFHIILWSLTLLPNGLDWSNEYLQNILRPPPRHNLKHGVFCVQNWLSSKYYRSWPEFEDKKIFSCQITWKRCLLQSVCQVDWLGYEDCTPTSQINPKKITKDAENRNWYSSQTKSKTLKSQIETTQKGWF